MPIQAVYLQIDAYLSCLNHALSTEKEEIMGLLLGHVSPDSDYSGVDDTKCHSFVESVVVLQRSDRKPDRVEISPVQLMSAAQEAEKLTQQLGRPVRVLGWYHSHPHITVGPSHVGIASSIY